MRKVPATLRTDKTALTGLVTKAGMLDGVLDGGETPLATTSYMRIVALLPHGSTQALQRCVGSADTLTRVAGTVALVRLISAHAADAVVIDPAELSDADWSRARLVLQAARVPVLVYIPLDRGAIKRVLAATAIGSHEVLFRDIDDDPAAIRRRLESLGTPAPPSRVLSTLAGRIERLPNVLQDATVPLFCSVPVPRWADDIAQQADVPRRSVDRWMYRAGLSGTAAVLDVARLARTWVPLVDGGRSQSEVAVRNGYRRMRMLAVHARRVVGVSPSHFGTRLSADEFVRRLTQHAIRD